MAALSAEPPEMIRLLALEMTCNLWFELGSNAPKAGSYALPIDFNVAKMYRGCLTAVAPNLEFRAFALHIYNGIVSVRNT